MIRRFLVWVGALLKSLDILGLTLLKVIYIFNLCDKPTGRQMISSYVGKAKTNGHRWGRIVAWVIDHVAMLLGDRPEHCVRAYRHYRGKDL